MKTILILIVAATTATAEEGKGGYSKEFLDRIQRENDRFDAWYQHQQSLKQQERQHRESMQQRERIAAENRRQLESIRNNQHPVWYRHGQGRITRTAP